MHPQGTVDVKRVLGGVRGGSSYVWIQGRTEERGEVIMSDSSEVIVVASKVKAYIKSQGDMKTSANVLQTLSDRIRTLCDEAMESARSDGRKTVLDRDIP